MMDETNNAPENPTPRPATMLKMLSLDDLEVAYAEQATGQLVLGLESLMHKLSDLAKIDAMESPAYTHINIERLNIEAELERRTIELLRG